MNENRIEAHIINVIDELVRLDPSISKLICDVGANSEAPIAHHFVTHHAFAAYLFEPQESCIFELDKRFKNQPNVTVIQAALGDNSGEMPFYESSDGPGGECATLYDGNDPWQDIAVNKSKSEMIQVYKSDEIFEKCGIGTIGILKVDTEGFDFNVLKGINLSRYKPSIIVTEEYLWNVNSTFQKYDYLDESGYVLLGFYEYNSVWVKKGFGGITNTRIATSGTHRYQDINSIISKLHHLEQLLKRSERDENFSIANIDVDIGVKDVSSQGDRYLINFYIFNRGQLAIPSCKAHDGKQLFVSYHLRDTSGEMLSWDNPRLSLRQDVAPKEVYLDSFFVKIPKNASGIWVDMDIVDEGIGWYSAEQSHKPNSIFIIHEQ